MYEKPEVWKRAGSGLAIRFQCLRRLSDGMFAVQNADFPKSRNNKADLQASDTIFVEVFLDEDPTNRCEWFSSVSEAISSHEKDFADMPGDP